jgi:hypothetical protein
VTADGPLAASVALPTDTHVAEQLAAAALNVEALGLTDVELSPALDDDVTDDASVDQVLLTWRLPGGDQTASQTLEINWRTTEQGASIAGVAAGATTLPLWVLEPLDVRRASRVLVAGGRDTAPDSLLADADKALKRVGRVFPTWQGRLFVEAPSTPELLAESLATNAASYDDVAAVTTSIDGSVGDLVGQRVLIHPATYPAMDGAAARFVMTHEVVHVAMESATRPLPLWWSEGLAEYVAFSTAPAADARLTNRLLVLAGRSLAADLRDHGLPRELPSAETFGGNRQDAAYEASRRACEVLVALASGPSGDETAVTKKLFGDFNEMLARGRDVEEAVPAVFGVTYARFLRTWQRALREVTPTS